jgi:hypothetical protein
MKILRGHLGTITVNTIMPITIAVIPPRESEEIITPTKRTEASNFCKYCVFRKRYEAQKGTSMPV